MTIAGTAAAGPETAGPSDASAFLVAGYAAAVASGEPAPGGGSVAGVVGALAAALVEMVSHMSVGRTGTAMSEKDVADVVDSATALRARLLELATADEAAYSGYVAATKLPKSTDEEKATRRDALQTALGNAADAPLAIASACHEVLMLLDPLTKHGNKHLISDTIIAALCAEVAARSALLNVRVNAKMIKDEERSRSYWDTASSVEAAVRDHAAAIIATATKRL